MSAYKQIANMDILKKTKLDRAVIWYGQDVNDEFEMRDAEIAAQELLQLRNEHKFMSEQIDKLNAPMPCGHLARYAVNEEDGTQYCCMCDRNVLLDAGNETLAALKSKNKLFEEACLYLAYHGYGVSADKFIDLPLDVQKYILGMFTLEVMP